VKASWFHSLPGGVVAAGLFCATTTAPDETMKPTEITDGPPFGMDLANPAEIMQAEEILRRAKGLRELPDPWIGAFGGYDSERERLKENCD
jgi:hypothetical protein